MPSLSLSRAHSRQAPHKAGPRTSMSKAHSRPLPPKAKDALQVSSDPTQSPAEDQQASQSKRMKGLGLAGIATVFQAVMSVCAKILGESLQPVAVAFVQNKTSSLLCLDSLLFLVCFLFLLFVKSFYKIVFLYYQSLCNTIAYTMQLLQLAFAVCASKQCLRCVLTEPLWDTT